jgi:catechol 2,3-dioxygenase-like lactoylglutathione lyase family enzyme
VIETEGLTHIHLLVRDLDRSLGFYQAVFGLEEKFREGETMVFLGTAGGDTITLNEVGLGSEIAGIRGGIDHFGFRLRDGADLDRAIAEVEAAGGRLVRRGDHPSGVPFAYVTDPDGYQIEL